jgi:2-C-methyl-D-erythritol 4-phosphate cytidylyltransferase
MFMKCVAIIPAGGAGRRMGGGVPKQYLPLAGLPLLVHTLRVFWHSPLVSRILLAVPEADIPQVRARIVEPFGLADRVRVLAGGDQRQDSVRNALSHIREDDEIVLVHDGVRPCLWPALIEQAVAAAAADGAAVAGVPVTDTLKETTPEGWVARTVPREGLWSAQTPQAFRREILAAAHERAAADGFYGTDEAALVERIGFPVRMIPGGEENIKVTTRADLLYAEAVLGRRDADRFRL